MTAVNPPPSFVIGEAPFAVPGAGQPCKTWYKVYGDLKSGVRPLILLHGGPGVAHDYLEVLARLTTLYSIPVVLYDQLGCARSTHLPEKLGDTDFWTVQLFIDELRNLLVHLGIQDDYDLLGHSWGGMIIGELAVQQPKGLHKIVIADSPASIKLWMDAAAILRLKLPQDVQDVLNKHEADDTTAAEEYHKAIQVYHEHFLCRVKPFPQVMTAGFEWLAKDPTVHTTMYGTKSFDVNGSLKTWSVIDDLHKINVPTLLVNGRHDQAHDITMQPYFQHVPNVKWMQFAESSHVPHLEETDAYVEVVGNFLLNY